MAKVSGVQQAIDKIDAEIKALQDTRNRLVAIAVAQPKRKRKQPADKPSTFERAIGVGSAIEKARPVSSRSGPQKGNVNE
jgi:chorismate mutase